MPIKFLNFPDKIPEEEKESLETFCSEHELDLTLEWKNGQAWLHSDIPKENPIGIEIDKELSRHLDYFRKSSIHKELLARAIGVKGGYRPKVLDLSAGLLGDTLLFLSFGCEVTAVERHPVVAFLIESAISNSKHPLIKNLKFYKDDAKSCLDKDLETEVIFYDPMFEDANEKASPRKEMRIFRSVVGQDQDAKEVFIKALNKNAKRLVVKRPRHSIALGAETPLSYPGKATRYDVYLSQSPRTFGSNLLE